MLGSLGPVHTSGMLAADCGKALLPRIDRSTAAARNVQQRTANVSSAMAPRGQGVSKRALAAVMLRACAVPRDRGGAASRSDPRAPHQSRPARLRDGPSLYYGS